MLQLHGFYRNLAEISQQQSTLRSSLVNRPMMPTCSVYTYSNPEQDTP